jgi:hypothetical protein
MHGKVVPYTFRAVDTFNSYGINLSRYFYIYIAYSVWFCSLHEMPVSLYTSGYVPFMYIECHICLKRAVSVHGDKSIVKQMRCLRKYFHTYNETSI